MVLELASLHLNTKRAPPAWVTYSRVVNGQRPRALSQSQSSSKASPLAFT
jgi:hypothetical protein